MKNAYLGFATAAMAVLMTVSLARAATTDAGSAGSTPPPATDRTVQAQDLPLGLLLDEDGRPFHQEIVV